MHLGQILVHETEQTPPVEIFQTSIVLLVLDNQILFVCASNDTVNNDNSVITSIIFLIDYSAAGVAGVETPAALFMISD